MKQTCKTCEEYERLRLHAGRVGVRVKKERPILLICKCDPDTPRFVLFGPLPRTRPAVDLLAKDIKRHIGLSKAPGPKPKEITYWDILNAYAKIPGAPLFRLAQELNVSTRKIQNVLKVAEHTFTSFKAEFLQTRRDKSRFSLRFKRSKFK